MSVRLKYQKSPYAMFEIFMSSRMNQNKPTTRYVLNVWSKYVT